jgi:hypothetical protein
MKSPSIKELVKVGFGISLGSAAAMMIFSFFGILLLIWGMSLLKKARANGSSVMPAYAVMVLGVAIGLGMGATTVLGEASMNF